MTTSDSRGDSSPTWRELAVARSLDSARARAESRVQRFLDAALDLMADSDSGKDFTVQEVVERSGQSLRSFYQYFGGKHELLLALFEESVRSSAEQLRVRVTAVDDPLERLRCFVVEYHKMCRPVGRGTGKGKGKGKRGPTPALAEFAQQLLTAQPAEAARAFVPIVTHFEEVLAEATAAGVVRGSIRGRRVAGIVLEAIMFDAFSTTIGGPLTETGSGDPADELWDLLLHGIAA